MRIVHWCIIKPNIVSGLIQRVKELHKVELALGFESGICNPDTTKKQGEKLVDSTGKVTFDLKPWSWAETEDAVNVIHSHRPQNFEELKHRVFVVHGGPEPCVYTELYENKNSYTTAINLIDDCELTVCWSKRQHRIWKEYDGSDKVHFVQGGVDLERWTPEGSKLAFTGKPAVCYMSMWRSHKPPFYQLLAAKKAYREIPRLRLELFNINVEHQLFWMRFICKLNIDKIVENFGIGMLADPSQMYRSVDMLLESDSCGDMTGTAAEAMASGCPVILIEGEEHANMKCRNSPDGIADVVVQLWNRMKDNPELEKKKAREIALKYYNIENTIKGMVKLYQGVFQR